MLTASWRRTVSGATVLEVKGGGIYIRDRFDPMSDDFATSGHSDSGTGIASVNATTGALEVALHDFRMASSLYEGLVLWDNHDFSIEPGVAESWSISEDGRTYTFHLRTDARWSTGEPVTSADFVYAFRRLLMPDTATPVP